MAENVSTRSSIANDGPAREARVVKAGVLSDGPAGPVRKLAKLISIDDEQSIVRCISRSMKRICDVPDELPAVDSLEKALALFKSHAPDIVICDKNFGAGEEGHFMVLDAVKAAAPNTIVILFSGTITDNDMLREGTRFDAIIEKPEWEKLRSTVADFAGRITSADAVPQPVDAATDKATMTVRDQSIAAQCGNGLAPEQVIERANTLPSIPVSLARPPETVQPVVSELATAETLPSELIGAKAPVRKNKKLLIIEDEQELVEVLVPMMNDICEVPDGMCASANLEDAKKKVEELNPDIIISDLKFDNSNPNAYHELLDFAKARNPNVLVILWSCCIPDGEHGSPSNAYDGMFRKVDYAGLILRVKQLTE